MPPDSRADLQARADRCVRRGELSEAVALYEQLLTLAPDDGALAEKLARLKESLQPMELQSAKAPRPEGVSAHPTTPEQEGERLFSLGDYAGAAAAYRRALKEKPDSELVRERLVELYALARTAPRHSPTDSALPADREEALRALLDRISARKKVVLG